MSEIGIIENYEAVVLGFENLLARPATAQALAEKAAYKQVAEITGDYRIANITDKVKLEAARTERSLPEQIAAVLYNSFILDDEDPSDPLVQGIISTGQELYAASVNEGLPAAFGAVDFATILAEGTEGRTGIVTASPLDEVIPFLKHWRLADQYPLEHVTASPPNHRQEVTHESYQHMAEKLGVSVGQKLLVIENSVPNALAAKATGAAVGVLLAGRPERDVKNVSQEYPELDWVSASLGSTKEGLGLPDKPKAKALL